MKFYKFLITAACIAIAAVCIALIVRVNRAFPNAEEVSYTKDNPADLDGLEIMLKYILLRIILRFQVSIRM